MSDEPRRLIEIGTFASADVMFIDGDDLAKLIREAERRAKAARIAEEAQPKPAEEPNRPVLLGRIGGLASGWFR